MTFLPPHSDPNYQALYIHIPFCARRCAYCDFLTRAVEDMDSSIDEHLQTLTQSLQASRQRGLLAEIQTVYIGGGTPSFIGSQRLVQLVQTITEVLPPSATPREFSVEANPESLSADLLAALVPLGVNRLSLGVQSLQDDELRVLGRLHDSQRARWAMRLALGYLDNVSVDLMCGLPGQTAASWQRTLAEISQLAVPHISVYPLTLESGTALALAVDRGELQVADDDIQADFLEQAEAWLSAGGWQHYEIASYARPGYACRHNTAYWSAQPYLGLGRGAVGMAMASAQQSYREHQENRRHQGPRQRQERQRFNDSGILETLNTQQQAAEDLLLRLRLLAGAPDDLVNAARQVLPGLDACLDQLRGWGLLESSEHSQLRLSRTGWLLGNQVFGRIWELVEAPPELSPSSIADKSATLL
ncbi:MAG: radical SAM family heme chaperone HemW [Actinomycetia bacterium]|nr:radical SAM family heme chaperone HemW [Actinomycetes bacterium]